MDTIGDILDEAAAWLRERGVDQWPPAFPRGPIAGGVRRGEWFLATRAGRPVATCWLTEDDPIMWGERPPDALYLHRLAVRREAAGAGRLLLAWAEAAVLARGRRLLRLDCVAANHALCAYYERAGYRCRGVGEHGGRVCRRYERELHSG